jgi:hypothetical protein
MQAALAPGTTALSRRIPGLRWGITQFVLAWANVLTFQRDSRYPT